MKRILFEAWMIGLLLAPLMVQGEEHSVFIYRARAYMGGATNEWRLSSSRLEHLPQWKGEGNPPLSVNKALKIARKWIVPKSGDGDVERILLRCIAADEESKHRHTFYYVIAFSVNPFGNHITCVVLMDGTVLEPSRYDDAP